MENRHRVSGGVGERRSGKGKIEVCLYGMHGLRSSYVAKVANQPRLYSNYCVPAQSHIRRAPGGVSSILFPPAGTPHRSEAMWTRPGSGAEQRSWRRATASAFSDGSLGHHRPPAPARPRRYIIASLFESSTPSASILVIRRRYLSMSRRTSRCQGSICAAERSVFLGLSRHPACL